MKIKKHKELYDAPSMLVFEVKLEGVIAASLPAPQWNKPFNDEEDW